MKKNKKIKGANAPFFSQLIVKLLEDKAIKYALKKLLIKSGIKKWLVSYIIKEFFEEIGEPLIKVSLIELGYIKNKLQGKITAEKIARARKYQNADDYHNAVNDIFE